MPPEKKPPYIDIDIDYICQQIEAQKLVLIDDYESFRNLAFALSHEYQSKGEHYFHIICKQSDKYNEQVSHDIFSTAVKRLTTEKTNIITIAWFVKLCTDNNLEVYSDRTKLIVTHTLLAKNFEAMTELQKKESTLEILKREGIEGTDVPIIIDKAYQLETSKRNKYDPFEDMLNMIKDYDLRFNQVTESMEIEGRNFTDKEFNNIFIDIRKKLGSKVSSSNLNAIIESDRTPAFNPFLEYLKTNTYSGETGYITAVCNCITSTNTKWTKATIEHFVSKWLLSIIASMNGTHSVMILVLLGGQGIGKTNFFRGLLPKKLNSYYAESKLDLEKDDMILMCNKLMICDDEFGGKSKQQEKQLKLICSKQRFTIRPPYHRRPIEMNRYAVLCGTTNDRQILNDLTGNRRVLPIDVFEIDLIAFNEIDKDLLFAELYQVYKNIGSNWQLDATDISILDDLTESNKLPSIEVESILRCFALSGSDGEHEELTSTEIIDHIGLTSKQNINPQKLGIALRNLGFEQQIVKRGKVTKRVYRMRKIPL